MAEQKRTQYKDMNYRPFLFFAVFGVSGEKLDISAEKHHADGFPAKLQMRTLNRADHAKYMDGFFAGSLGEVIKNQKPELFEQCRKAKTCVVISGQVEADQTFDYMRNVIGIIQALTEQGACGILDLLTFSLYSPQEWNTRFFEKEINALNHVVILFSEEEDGYWLHTRGMAEFGRPDLSMHGVAAERVPERKEILDQMIYYSGEGVFFDGSFTLYTRNGEAHEVLSKFVNNFENDDFNNAWCDVTVIEQHREPAI